MDLLTKKCRVCLEVKIITEFYNRASAKDGLEPVCKPCKIKKALEYKNNPTNQPRVKSILNDDGKTKYCGGCEMTKSINEFYRAKSSSDGLSSRCIDCFKINYRSNKEEQNKRALARYYKKLGKPMPAAINHYNTKVIPFDDLIPVIPTIDKEKLEAARVEWRAVFDERFDDIMKLLKDYDDERSESLNIVKKFHEEVRPKWKLKHKTTDKYEAHFKKYGCSGW